MQALSRFAAFRVVYGCVLLEDVLHLASHLQLFPHAVGTGFLLPALLGWAVILLCFISGYWLKAAVIANYLCCSVILGWLAPNGGFQVGAVDSIIISLALLAVLIATVSIPVRIVFALYLSSIYIDSGLHKLASSMWCAGAGVSVPLSLPSLAWHDMSWMQYFPPQLLGLLGWSVILFELSFPLFYFWRRTRLLVLLAGIGMHLGIALLYPIPVFGGIMLSVYAALLPEACYRASAESSPFGLPTKLPYAFAVWGAAVIAAYLPVPHRASLGQVAIKGVRKISYMATGVASHEVFADDAFRYYKYQLRLIDEAGTSWPYDSHNLLPLSIRDRVWEQWWKRTQGPSASISDAELSLLVWANSRYSGHSVHIEARPQFVNIDKVETSLFSQNNLIPWTTIGQISGNQVHWDLPPHADRESMGQYIPMTLARF